MDYKKIHEKSVAIAKRLVDEGKISRKYAERMFSELEESEDEKIKNEIKVVLALADFSQLTLNYTFYDMVFWLEKKCEQKGHSKKVEKYIGNVISNLKK